MTHLNWRDCVPSDRPALQRFECTVPGNKMKQAPWKVIHPRAWERSLQGEIHNMRPQCGDQRSARLGFSEAGALSGVVVTATLEAPDLFLIQCVAIGTHLRGTGSPAAEEAIEQAIEWAVGKVDVVDLDSARIVAKSHRENKAAEALLERTGFGVYQRRDNTFWWRQQVWLV